MTRSNWPSRTLYPRVCDSPTRPCCIRCQSGPREVTVPAFESPELLELFQTYTAAPGSIGAHFAQTAARAHQNDPLIVATGTDLALYPGDGSPPSVEGFRMSTRGFKELAGISHLGPALATLTRMKELDESSGWRSDAERLLDATLAARAANSTELWRD